MAARVVPRSNRFMPLGAALLLALALATSAHGSAEDDPDTSDGVRKLIRYLRCTVEIIIARDVVTVGAATTDCLALYLSEAH